MRRALVFAAAMVVVRLVQGALINAFQPQTGLINIVLTLLFLFGVVVWGAIDGRADAAANPDLDRRGDLAMTWLLAGLVAGVLSGAVAWLSSLVYQAVYVGGLLNELTTFAAFTALLVFLGGIGGVALGRWLIDRSGGDQQPAGTDVFAAVRPDDATTQRGAMPELPTGQVSPEAQTDEDEC
jgi:hypothetical protein